MARVPDPPAQLDLELEEWPNGRTIVRVYPAAYGPTSFNSTTDQARFRPVYSSADAVVPTLYGSESFDAAIAETILHDLSARWRKTVPFARVRDRVQVELAPARTLQLAAFHGAGLQRTRLRRNQLIDTGPPTYPQTAKWGQKAWEHPERIDGIVWMSRQYDSQRAIMLFQDRVEQRELNVIAGSLLPLDAGAGYELLARMVQRAGFRINRP